MVNAYLKCVDAQEARAGAEGIDETTGCGYSNVQAGVRALSMGVSHGNCNNYSKSNSKTKLELSLITR
jgi:hypothetical protein